MIDNLSYWLNQIPDGRTEKALRPIVLALMSAFGSAVLTATTLAIGTTTTKFRTSTTTCRYMIGGKVFTKAATDDLFTPAGVIAQAKYNVYVAYLDSSGNAAVRMGTEGATEAAVRFPETPEGYCPIGYALVTKSDTAFTGGTTALNAANVTTVYVPLTGPFIPNANVS